MNVSKTIVKYIKNTITMLESYVTLIFFVIYLVALQEMQK